MNLFRMYWVRTLQKPGAIFLWLLIPFVFMTIYTLAFGGNNTLTVGLAVVDRDSSLVSGLLKGSFDRPPLADLIEIHPATDLDKVEGMFSRGNVSAALVIPPGFGQHVLRGDTTTLVLYNNPRHFIGPQIAEGAINGLAVVGNGFLGLFEESPGLFQSFTGDDTEPTADDLALVVRNLYTPGSDAPNPGAIFSTNVAIVDEQEKQPWESNMAAMFFPGLVAFALLSLSMALEYRFLFDRKNRINQRIVVSPMRPSNILLQQRLYSVTFLFAMAVVTAILGGIIFKIPANGLLNVTIVTVALVLFITGINGIIFGMSNSLKAVSAMSSVVIMVLLAMGGGFFPIEFYPGWTQSIAERIPTGMANIALTRSLTGRAPDISFPVLYAYCGAFFALSIIVGRKRIV